MIHQIVLAMTMSADLLVRCCAVMITAVYLVLLHFIVRSLFVQVNVLVSLDYCLKRLAIALLCTVEYPVDGNVDGNV